MKTTNRQMWCLKFFLLAAICNLIHGFGMASEWGDNSIKFDNKTIKLTDRGGIDLLVDNRPIYSSSATIWYPGDSPVGPIGGQIKPAKWTSIPGSLSFDSVIECNGTLVPYKITAELQADNQLKITVICPRETLAGDYKFRNGGFHLTFPMHQFGKSEIRLNNVAFSFSEGEGNHLFLQSPDGGTVAFFTDDQRKAFRLKTTNPIQCYKLKTPNENRVNFRVYPAVASAQPSNPIVIWLDFTGSPQPESSGKEVGGIDFTTLDQLEMPDYASSRNLLTNPSFEQGMYGLNFLGSFGNWPKNTDEAITVGNDAFIVDDTVAKFGKSSLRIMTLPMHPYFLSAYAIRLMPVPATPGKYTLSFYARANYAGQTLRLFFPDSYKRIDCSMLFNKTIQPTREWQRYTLTFENKHIVPLELRIQAYNSGRGLTFAQPGHIWVDGVQLETGEEATEFTSRPIMGKLVTSAEGNFLPIESASDIQAMLRIATAPKVSGKAVITVKNFFGDVVPLGEFAFTSGDDGVARVDLPLDGKFDEGIYVVRAEYTLSSGVKFYEHYRFSLMKFLKNTHRLKNLFGGQSVENNLVNAKNFPPRMQALGLGAVCHVMDPLHDNKKIEAAYKQHGIEYFNAFTDLSLGWWSHKEVPNVTTLYVTSVKRLPPSLGAFRENVKGDILDYQDIIDDPECLAWNRYSPFTEAYLAKMPHIIEDYIKLCPDIKVWSLDGEIMARLDPATPSEEKFKSFVAAQVAFYNAAKKANPKAMIASNASPTLNVHELSRTLDALKGKLHYDIIACHGYVGGAPDFGSKDTDADLRAYIETLNTYEGYTETPIFIPEAMLWGPYRIPQYRIDHSGINGTGWQLGALSYDMGQTEKLTAAWVARTWLMALKYQDRIKCFNSQMATYPGFALDTEITPYAIQKPSNTLGNLLGDARFVEDIKFAPYTRCYLFENAQQQPVVAVWNYHPRLDDNTMTAPLGGISFSGLPVEAFNLMGAVVKLERSASGETTIPLSNFPHFFRFPAGSTAQVAEMFRRAFIKDGKGDLASLVFSAKPLSPEKASLLINNYAGEQRREITVAGRSPEQVVIQSGEGNSIEVPLPKPLRYDAISSETFPVSFTNADHTSYNENVSFNGLVIGHPKQPIVIDGDLQDWNGIPEIKFQNAINRDKIASDADFSGSFRTAWTSEGLYIAAHIRDDVFVTEGEAGPFYNNDCLQIYIDSRANARASKQKGYDEDDYDFAVYVDPTTMKPVFYCSRRTNQQIAMTSHLMGAGSIVPGVPTSFKRTSDGYIYEIFIPAIYVLPAKVEKGSVLGLGLYVADRDNPSQDGKTQKGLTLSSEGTGCFNNPHLWPAVLLWE